MLNGEVLELQDGAYPLLEGIIATTDPEVAFKDADFALLVGARPRGPGMERADLLQANAAIFRSQGEVLNRVAKASTRVIVVGNPANTNALICAKSAPNIPVKNFSALTRLDQNRARSQIALQANCKVSQVENLCIWGNHSSTQYPDTFNATIGGRPLREVIPEASHAWLDSEFIERVQKRGAEIISVKNKSSAASAANAVCDHVRDLFLGTGTGDGDVEGIRFVSMGVISDGNPYGVADGLIYSFPCRIKDGEWTIVPGLAISEFSQERMTASANELIEERSLAFAE